MHTHKAAHVDTHTVDTRTNADGLHKKSAGLCPPMTRHLALVVWFEECSQRQKGGKGVEDKGGGAVFLEKQHWQHGASYR